MKNCVKLLGLLAVALVLAAPALAQETASAKATRKRLQQKISVEWKEVGLKIITEDIKGEVDQPISFKIDNTSGLSNNTKLTYKADNKTVQEILNGLSDKGDFGWYVRSDRKDRYDGFVILRRYKDKERGYEAGKGPVKGASSGWRPLDRWQTRQTALYPAPRQNLSWVLFYKD